MQKTPWPWVSIVTTLILTVLLLDSVWLVRLVSVLVHVLCQTNTNDCVSGYKHLSLLAFFSLEFVY